MSRQWRKSTFSGDQGACVLWEIGPDGVSVSDSKNPDGPELRFTLREWQVFLQAVRAGECDVE